MTHIQYTETPVQLYRRGGFDVFYPSHPLYSSARLQNARVRNDNRDKSFWQGEVIKATTARLRGLAGG